MEELGVEIQKSINRIRFSRLLVTLSGLGGSLAKFTKMEEYIEGFSKMRRNTLVISTTLSNSVFHVEREAVSICVGESPLLI